MFQRLFSNNKKPSDYRVLVVDDDQAIRQTIADILQEEGFIVSTAGSGEEALTVLDKAEEKHNALIVDLMMPEMDGKEFIARARVRHGRSSLPPILLLTAARNGEVEANVIEVDDFIPKPFDQEELLRHIYHMIETRNTKARSA